MENSFKSKTDDRLVWFAVKEEESRRKAQDSVAAASIQAKEQERIQREEMRRELQGGK